jgi:hypothetical protein
MPRTRPVSLQCEQCHRAFDCWDYRPTRPQRLCSRACRDAAQTTRVVLECRQCRRPFERKAYMEGWSQERGPFCSFDCYGQWQAENTAGEANPNYHPGATSRDCLNWRLAREAALERDGHRCTNCGREDRLHVHHVGDPDCHELGNLRTLCERCHRTEHRLPRQPDGRFSSTR